MFDINTVRAHFPITRQKFPVYGATEPVPVIYFDHGASTHPPQPVIDEYVQFLRNSYSNVHRGQHYLSQISTDMFEEVYAQIRTFIHAEERDNCIILASNTTHALDVAAHIMSHVDGATLVSVMEHHSNDLPHRRHGEVFRAEVLADGTLDYADVERNLREHKIKLLAITGASNVTGFLPDLKRLATMAHAHGARILVDAAQLLAHKAIDVLPNNDPAHIDFVAAAGHKAYAPFGSSFLFGPRDLMDNASPYIPGGGTVVYVTDEEAYFDKSPDRHQGGTPNIAGAIALGSALRFLNNVGMDAIRKHEIELTELAMNALSKMDGVHVLGHPDPTQRLGVVAMTIDGVTHDEAAIILNYEAAIATRNGCFCAHPYLHRLLGLTDTTELRNKLVAGEDIDIPGAVRATFGIFNNEAEVHRLIAMIDTIRNRRWKADYTNFDNEAVCRRLVPPHAF